jgi:hypothetical protein
LFCLPTDSASSNLAETIELEERYGKEACTPGLWVTKARAGRHGSSGLNPSFLLIPSSPPKNGSEETKARHLAHYNDIQKRASELLEADGSWKDWEDFKKEVEKELLEKRFSVQMLTERSRSSILPDGMSSFDTYWLILKEFAMLDLFDRLSSSYSDLVSQIRAELFRFRVGPDEAAFAQNHVLCERINSACGWKLPSHELKLMLDRINWIKHDETFEWMTCEYTAVELYRGRLNWNKEQQEERLEAARNALDCESCMLILFDSFVLMTSSPRSFMY